MKSILRSLPLIVLAHFVIVSNARTKSIRVAASLKQDTCPNVSTLPCSAITVNTPFSLDFNSPVPNSINDKNGLGTGFTTVNNYSGTRLTQDGQPTNTAVRGYEQSKINLTGGRLLLTANKGIDYLTNNNQLNVLGAQIVAANKLQLEVKVVNPFNGTQSQQAGLWYGINDKTFIKLSVTGNKIELRKEYNDVSSTAAGTANPDQRVTAVISGLSTQTVTLRLIIDTQHNTAEGFYSTNGTNFLNAGAGYPSSQVSLANMGITSGNVYAGIYATYRNGTSPVVYTFDDFNITSTVIAPFSGCPLISTVPCANIKATTNPFKLTFDQSVPNSINDKNGVGTGFTTVNNYSKPRLAEDGQPSIQEVPGYEPSRINVTGGRLQITANKGIDFLTNNNQLNLLGAQIDAANKVQLDVKLINPYNATQSQQAGLWYGIDDKTYIKLGVTGNKVELRKEFNDVSSSVAGSSNPDQRVTAVISGLNTQTVSLRLIVDSVAQTVQGLYSTDGVNYKSAGAVGYAQSFLNITGLNVTTGQLYAGVFATYRNGTSPVTYTFDDFSITRTQSVTQPTQPLNTLRFSKDTVSFTVVKNGPLIAQSVSVTGNPVTNGVSLAKINADWLTLPATFNGTLQLNAQSISTALNAGHYEGLVAAAALGYASDTLHVNLTVVDAPQQQAINVNFQDAATIPPTGYVRDYGQPYGDRTGLYQGAQRYGWRKRSDGSLLSLVGNGRNRNTPEDIVLATVFHMQANDISGTFTGVKTEGYWEIKVPNGTYDVTATVGDGQVNMAPESHSLVIEGVSAISNFVPAGKKGEIGRFKTKTVRVNVTDENLTIKADGGTNTKINGASIVPVSLNPYLFWSAGTKNVVLKKGGPSSNNIMSLTLGGSDNLATSYSLTTQYTGSSTGWLNCTQAAVGTQSNVTFNYNAAQNLPVGVYYATVKAAASQYTSADFKLQLNVVDTLRPYVKSSSPANASTNVSVNTVSIAANNLSVPAVAGFNGGVNNTTITDTTVKLFKIVDGVQTKISGTVQGTGGGDAISFSPTTILEPNTLYKFTITDGVKSNAGSPFVPYESTFVTGDLLVDSASMLNAQFTKVAIPGTQNIKYSSLAIGPDDKFYALRLNGAVERYTINHSTGMLSNKQMINTLVNKYGNRTAIGLAFDPSSTPTQPILWISHSSSGLTAAPSFDGNISRLYGDSLQLENLMVTKLPRSSRDHMTNSLAFGPDGALYICQGSNSSAGAYDDDWQRDETLLAGAVLRLDVTKLSTYTLPLNVQTTSNLTLINSAPADAATMGDGTYNPYGSLSPLTIYASGVRNAFDLLWHSNGQLYIPANGSGGGGNSPASVNGTRRPNGSIYNGPVIPSTKGVPVQVDWLFRVNPTKPIGYYGHPNPLRGEYVINRGYADNPLYSPAIVPDVNYRIGYNFGLNHSPNGVLEYKSNTFNGVLKGKILVCRFSGGGDIEVMQPGSMVKIDTLGSNDAAYDIVKVTTGSGYNGLVGMSGFANPLDIVEDTSTGNLYVSELNWNDNPNQTAQITLLQAQSVPAPPMPMLAVTAEIERPDNDNRKVYSINLSNRGDGMLAVKSIALAGSASKLFNLQDIELPTAKKPLTLQKNSTLNFNIKARMSSNRSVTKLVVTDVNDVTRTIELNNQADTTAKRGEQLVSGNRTIDAIIDQRQLVSYPNPNTGNIIYIQLKNFQHRENVNVALYDMMGKMLKQQKVAVDANGQFATQFSIENNSLNKFYIVRAVYDSGSRSSKIIIN